MSTSTFRTFPGQNPTIRCLFQYKKNFRTSPGHLEFPGRQDTLHFGSQLKNQKFSRYMQVQSKLYEPSLQYQVLKKITKFLEKLKKPLSQGILGPPCHFWGNNIFIAKLGTLYLVHGITIKNANFFVLIVSCLRTHQPKQFSQDIFFFWFNTCLVQELMVRPIL